ncbi:hypothetical protein Hthe01_20540 [Hydrogenophilus thermoluteolus]|uniref:hypothetical protein n=1 Tax=Hydrogenophilus thermoluteolus TaxID=297 RepID=UPI0024A33E83|nr:hypothetical protein [Hydrogenophilus thermoluteolus]GLW61705.1 hypothetical protein Hthe01_20540 [Hydrogenophilus thermoluteolus]
MPAKAKTDAREPKSLPYFVQKIRLNSFHAQQVFNRGFDRCANAIFTLSVVLRAIGTEDQAREVEGVVDDRFNRMFEELRAESARLDKLAEANGIEMGGIDYTHPKEVEARISTPRAVRYAGLIREFDGLVSKFDALWLSGVIPDSEYSRSLYLWKRQLLRLAGSIRSITTRAMNAARKKNEQGNKGASNTEADASAA